MVDFVDYDARMGYLGELHGGRITDDTAVLLLVAGVADNLLVPDAKVRLGCGALPEHCDGRSNIAAIGRVLNVVQEGLKHGAWSIDEARVEDLINNHAKWAPFSLSCPWESLFSGFRLPGFSISSVYTENLRTNTEFSAIDIAIHNWQSV